MKRMYRKPTGIVARRFATMLPVICLSSAVLVSVAGSQRAQAQAAQPPAATKPAEIPGYKIAPGDALEISVLEHPELSKTVTVLPEGIISYPYIGDIKVSGSTVSELRALITKRLNKEIDGPQVTIGLTRHQEDAKMVSAIGAVKTNGKRVMGENWRVLDLIADCGGLSADKPEWTTAMLIRGGGAQTININMSTLMASGDVVENRLLEPGDILVIREMDVSKTQVKVSGAVAKQGMVAAPGDGSINTVLLSAGGPTAGALLGKAIILRDGVSIPVDLTSAEAIEKGPKVKPGDTLIIPENKNAFAVMGAVGKSGPQFYPENGKLTVYTAVISAGGTAPGADLKKASIVRSKKDGTPDIIPVNLDAIMKSAGKDSAKLAKNDVPLAPGDVLFIPQKENSGGSSRMTLRDAISFLPFVGFLAR